jgi:hypothetical protein
MTGPKLLRCVLYVEVHKFEVADEADKEKMGEPASFAIDPEAHLPSSPLESIGMREWLEKDSLPNLYSLCQSIRLVGNHHHPFLRGSHCAAISCKRLKANQRRKDLWTSKLNWFAGVELDRNASGGPKRDRGDHLA